MLDGCIAGNNESFPDNPPSQITGVFYVDTIQGKSL